MQKSAYFLSLAIIFGFVLMSANTYALEYYNPNTEITSDITGFWIEEGSQINDVLYGYNCWTPSYNASGYLVIDFKNDVCGLGDNVISTLRIHPIRNSNYIHTYNSSVDELISTQENNEIILHNNKLNIFTTSFRFENGGETNIDANTFGIYLGNNGRLIGTPPTSFSTKNITDVSTNSTDAILQIKWINPQNNTRLVIDYAKVWTYDEVSSSATLFTSSLAEEKCGNTTSGTGTLVQGKNFAYFESNGIDNFKCGVFQLDKSIITRAVNVSYNNVVGYCNNAVYVSRANGRDIEHVWALTNVTFSFPNFYMWGSESIFSKLDNQKYEISATNETQLFGCAFAVSYSGNIQFNGGGIFPYGEIYHANMNKFKSTNYSWTGTANGLKHKFTGLPDTNYYDNFALDCSNSQFFCTANTQFTFDTSCNLISNQSCGGWGCKLDGTTCNVGQIGTYCLNNYTLRTVNSTGFTTSETVCGFGESCVVINGVASCLTEEEIELANRTITSTVGGFVGSAFGVSEEAGLNIFGLMLAIGIAGGVAMALAGLGGFTHIGQVFLIVFIASILTLTTLGWINIVFGIIFVIIAGFIVVKTMSDVLT